MMGYVIFEIREDGIFEPPEFAGNTFYDKDQAIMALQSLYTVGNRRFIVLNVIYR